MHNLKYVKKKILKLMMSLILKINLQIPKLLSFWNSQDSLEMKIYLICNKRPYSLPTFNKVHFELFR